MARVLGIDPGTACGWALLDDGMRVASGTWDLSVKRGESEAMRWIRLERQLTEALGAGTLAVDLVAYELVKRHLGTYAAQVYGGIVAGIQTVCHRHSVPFAPVLVQDVKKRATGKGNAPKLAMVGAAMGHWYQIGWQPSEDEADALWIALCGTEMLGAVAS